MYSKLMEASHTLISTVHTGFTMHRYLTDIFHRIQISFLEFTSLNLMLFEHSGLNLIFHVLIPSW